MRTVSTTQPSAFDLSSIATALALHHASAQSADVTADVSTGEVITSPEGLLYARAANADLVTVPREFVFSSSPPRVRLTNGTIDDAVRGRIAPVAVVTDEGTAIDTVSSGSRTFRPIAPPSTDDGSRSPNDVLDENLLGPSWREQSPNGGAGRYLVADAALGDWSRRVNVALSLLSKVGATQRRDAAAFAEAVDAASAGRLW